MSDCEKDHADVLIVGGGHGGAQAAIALRQQGFRGTVRIVTEEVDFPYERPPLSKEYLCRDKPFERLLIRPESFWAEKEVDFSFGVCIERIDPERQVACDATGRKWSYGRMIWAAGGHPRRLSCKGADVAGVHVIRSRSDTDRVAREIEGIRHAAIVGGGYIGLEAAAALTKFGKEVTVIEAQDRVLARVTAEPVAAFFEAEHRARGVAFELRAVVTGFEEEGGRVSGVRLDDGHVIPAELVIVGVGLNPSFGPLLVAGARCNNGVEVDEFCRTSLSNIYAIGDCAAHVNSFGDGRVLRLESVQNATDQASVVARDIMGQKKPYASVPWFWSNQYDLKLQTVGLNIGYDQIVLRGTPSRRSFSVVYLREGRVIALDCINAVADYAQGKALVQARAEVLPELLADITRPLRSMLVADLPQQ